MAEQRLPLVEGDDGQWGTILNQYLTKEHYNSDTDLNQATSENGGHKTVTLQPGTTAAGTAPIKLTSGLLMTNPEVGALEFLTDRLYFTQTTATTRKTIAAYDDSSGATGDIYYRDSSANLVRLGVSPTAGAVLNVNSGLPAWGPATATAATVSTIALRDANANLTATNLINGLSSTATAAGTTTLVASSNHQQYFTGSTTQTVVMPDAISGGIVIGQKWQIVNNSTGLVTVNSHGANLIATLNSGTSLTLVCISNSVNTAAAWSLVFGGSKPQITVGTTQPASTTANIGDLWIDTA